MNRLGLFLLLLVAGTTTALAGKNAGGALIVHTNDAIPNYRFGFCTTNYDDPVVCENAGTRTDRDGGAGEESIIWFIAALPYGSTPGVTAIDFGVDHNIQSGWIPLWGRCGPEGTVEEPSGDWPVDAQGAGNTVRFGQPIIDDRLFPFYWFACYGGEGSYLGSSIHRSLGYAAFHDDGDPVVIDPCNRFGLVRWYQDGYNECPEEGPGACCHADGWCTLTSLEYCLFLGGIPQEPGSLCDPNPCPQPDGACCLGDGSCVWVPEEFCDGTLFIPGSTCDPDPCRGACCFYNGTCTLVTEVDCIANGGAYQGPGAECDPNPCPQPGACCSEDGTCTYTLPSQCAQMGGEYTEAGLDCYPNPCVPADVEESRTISTTWGRVKTEYR